MQDWLISNWFEMILIVGGFLLMERLWVIQRTMEHTYTLLGDIRKEIGETNSLLKKIDFRT